MPANSSPVTESCCKISCYSQIETAKEASPHLQLQPGIAYLCRQMVELPLCSCGIEVVVLTSSSPLQESNEAEAPTKRQDTSDLSAIKDPCNQLLGREIEIRISVCKQSDDIIVVPAGTPTR